jgi:hypothetical protein
VAAYLASEAQSGLKPSTISRRCAAIRRAHKLAGHEPPTNSEAVKATLRSIHRAIGAAPARKAPGVAEYARHGHAAPTGLEGLRDHALLFCRALAGLPALRKALDAADLQETEDGLRVTFRRSKPIKKANA